MVLIKPLSVFVIWALVLLYSLMSIANQLIPKSYIKYLPISTNIALVVKSPGENQLLLSYNSSSYKPPASLQKLITSLAAKLYFEDDFTFITTLELLKHDVIIRFSGDPTLENKDLERMFSDYKKSYGSKIRGDIILDGSVFNGHVWANGLDWSNLSACYSAPSNSISLDHNCVYGQLNSHFPVGKIAKVQLPSNQPLLARSDAIILTRGDCEKMSCALDASLATDNQYEISGGISRTEKPIPLRFAVQNTEAYVSDYIENILKKLKIQHKGKIRVSSMAVGKVISEHHSEGLDKQLKSMLLESDNLISENILKTLGNKYYQQPGNFTNGAKAVVAIINEKAGIDLSTAFFADGSGLSLYNRLTARQMMQVLEYIYLNDKRLNLMNSLPVSGMSGTLKHRKGFDSDKLKGKIRAKTGSIFSTKNLAGVIETKSGKPLLFIQMITDYIPLEDREGHEKDVSKSKATRIERFEKALYSDLLFWQPRSFKERSHQ